MSENPIRRRPGRSELRAGAMSDTAAVVVALVALGVLLGVMTALALVGSVWLSLLIAES